MQNFLAVIYGLIFGISNIIPGVSGGTMMVVFGCYDKVCDALALNFKEIKKNLAFLIPFGIGAVLGIVGFSFVITWLFDSYPVPVYLFFIGLIIGSVPMVIRNINKSGKFDTGCIVLLAISLGLIILMGILQGDTNDGYVIKQVKSADDKSVTVVQIHNTTTQTVSEWFLEFDEGAVDAVGGAELFYNKGTLESITSVFTGEKEHKANAFKPFSDNTEIPPDGTVTFTYKSPKGTNLELEANMSYKVNYQLFIKLLFGGFIAAVAMIIPGVSGSFIMVLFGIYATVIGAIKDLNFLILIPAAVGIIAGVVLGARLIKYLLSNYSLRVYSVILGLLIGSVYVIFPKDFAFNMQAVIGIATFIVGVALSLTVGMEKKSNEDLKSTGKNLS